MIPQDERRKESYVGLLVRQQEFAQGMLRIVWILNEEDLLDLYSGFETYTPSKILVSIASFIDSPSHALAILIGCRTHSQPFIEERNNFLGYHLRTACVQKIVEIRHAWISVNISPALSIVWTAIHH